jgi:hypothetical protein
MFLMPVCLCKIGIGNNCSRATKQFARSDPTEVLFITSICDLPLMKRKLLQGIVVADHLSQTQIKSDCKPSKTNALMSADVLILLKHCDCTVILCSTIEPKKGPDLCNTLSFSINPS